MSRSVALARTAVVLLVATTAACTAPATADREPAGPSSEQVGRWLDAQSRATGDDVVASAASRVSADGQADAPVPGGDAQPDVSVALDSPTRVAGAHLDCTGPGTVDVTVSVTSGSGTSTTTVHDVPCDSDGRDVPLAVGDAVGLGFSGSGAERDGAWSAWVRGQHAG